MAKAGVITALFDVRVDLAIEGLVSCATGNDLVRRDHNLQNHGIAEVLGKFTRRMCFPRARL